MSEYARKGGMRGGHSLTVESRFSESQLHRPAMGPINDDHPIPEQQPKGLLNVGNTCYANAALQCLLSTALTNALLDPKVVPLLRSYSSNPNLLAQGSGSVDENDCDANRARKALAERERIRRKEEEANLLQDNCRWLTRELTQITKEYMDGQDEPVQPSQSLMGWLSTSQPSRGVVDPGSITRHPNRLSKCLQPYQQEDAHEFLRALISTLVMNGRNKKLSCLFDGLLESAVTCQSCGRSSLTRDRYMDLSLDIHDGDISSLDDALYEYTKTEVLEADNAVFCPKCDNKRSATKGLRLATAPSILVCHLKRFAFDKYGRTIRLHKRVGFGETLEIGDYMSSLNKSQPPPYNLVGILVHQGHSCASGHYLAFVKKHDEWYKCNDAVVTKVDLSTVLEQQAYILMYEVAEMRDRSGSTPRAAVDKQSQAPFVDEDDAEISKDGVSSHASSSWRYSQRSGETSSTKRPYQKFLHFLDDTEGITRFLADMCCDTSNFSEPQTEELQRKKGRRRDRSPDPSSADAILRKTASSERPNGTGLRRKKKPQTVRSQTAPRQRVSNDFYPVTGLPVSPRTTRSSVSDGRSKKQNRQKFTNADRHGRFSRSAYDLAASGDLPPLPRQRAKSTATRQKRGAIV